MEITQENTLIEQNKETILLSIVNAIKVKPISIVDISRKFNLNRSTTRYYLGLLRQERIINFERQENLPGRPTLVKFDELEAIKWLENIQQKSEEYIQKMKNSPITKEIEDYLKVHKGANTEQILQHIKLKFSEDSVYIAKTISSLHWLKNNHKITDEWVII
jgi:predicted transcriptional regulator